MRYLLALALVVPALSQDENQDPPRQKPPSYGELLSDPNYEKYQKEGRNGSRARVAKDVFLFADVQVDILNSRGFESFSGKVYLRGGEADRVLLWIEPAHKIYYKGAQLVQTDEASKEARQWTIDYGALSVWLPALVVRDGIREELSRYFEILLTQVPTNVDKIRSVPSNDPIESGDGSEKRSKKVDKKDQLKLLEGKGREPVPESRAEAFEPYTEFTLIPLADSRFAKQFTRIAIRLRLPDYGVSMITLQKDFERTTLVFKDWTELTDRKDVDAAVAENLKFDLSEYTLKEDR